MIGQKIGERYELLRLIGQGAMGVVYEAKHADTGRHVAVKLLTDEAARDEKLAARFEREAQTTAKILSSHVVEILGSGKDAANGHPYLVMELLAGENVEQLLARCGRLDPDLVVRIGAQACLGLQKAHQAGVVHRDIKPGNLFLARGTGDEVIVKLLDFAVGALKMEHASATGNESLVRGGGIIGSPTYMSPEQARALKSIDHRTDVWSLGMVLHEMLTGEACHHDASSLGDLIIAICAEQPASADELVPTVPKRVADVVAGALRLAVEERYADAHAMLAALDALLPTGRRISTNMLKAGVAAPPAASAIADLFDAAPGMDASGDDPTRASAKSEAAPRPRLPSRPTGIGVEEAKDGPTVSSPIEALVLSATPVVVAEGNATRGRRDEELFGPATASADRPVEGPASAVAPAPPSARMFGTSASRVALAVGAGLLFGLGGTLAYGLFAPEATSSPVPELPDGPAAATSVASVPASAAPTTAPTAAVSAEPAPTTVRVKVTPPMGLVTVDGERVTLNNGGIEITGPLESAHEVVHTVGGRSATTRVVLTADGPKPAEIVLKVAGGGAGRLPKGKLPDIYE